MGLRREPAKAEAEDGSLMYPWELAIDDLTRDGGEAEWSKCKDSILRLVLLPGDEVGWGAEG